MSNAPKVYAAICGVMQDIGKTGITKDRKNQQQGYSFRGIDDVYNELNGLLAKHGLAILPHVVSTEHVERQTKSGGALFYARLVVDFKIVCTDDGSSDTVRTVGEAMDSADKSSNKAMSAAYKYAAMMLFCIPTEADNDPDATTYEVAARPAKTASRKPFEDLVRDMRRCDTVADMDRWWTDADVKAIRAQLPEDWHENLKGQFRDMRRDLAAKQDADEQTPFA